MKANRQADVGIQVVYTDDEETKDELPQNKPIEHAQSSQFRRNDRTRLPSVKSRLLTFSGASNGNVAASPPAFASTRQIYHKKALSSSFGSRSPPLSYCSSGQRRGQARQSRLRQSFELKRVVMHVSPMIRSVLNGRLLSLR